jgi:HAD superfamily hydrolase (TIGR01509 family)
MNKKLLIWDFDGVILDSFAIDFEITKKFTGIKTLEEHHDIFSGNVHEWDVANKTPSHLDGKTFEEHLDEVIFEAKIFPEIESVITELSQKGIIQVIVSSAPGARIDILLKKHGLRDAFDGIYGAEVHRSKVTKFKMLAEKYSIDLSRALFVTDTLGDLREAEQVGLPAIAVSWGYHPHSHLELGRKIALVHSVSELQEVLSKKLID